MAEHNTAQYFIEGQHFGEAAVHPQAWNIALFCPECGDVWARIVCDLASEWQLIQCACSKHPRNRAAYCGRQPPGSIIPDWYIHTTEAAGGSPLTLPVLPPAVLEREFHLHLNYFERYYAD